MRTMRGLGRPGSLFSAAAACALACGLVAIPGVAHAADAETVTLPGDLLVNGDTQDTQAYTVSRGDVLTYTGRLDVTEVCKQIKAVGAQYDPLLAFFGKSSDNVALKDVTSTFSASFTLPAGLSLPADTAANAVFENKSLFAWTPGSAVVEGKTVTFTMNLAKNYTLFKTLKDDVCAEDSMTFTVPGVKVDADAPLDKNLTATGVVNGTFNGKGVMGGLEQPFNFVWDSIQAETGTDSETVSNDITLTVKIPSFGVSYRFGLDDSAAAAGVSELPAEIAALLPVDATRYAKGETISAPEPAPVTTADADGNTYTWTFKGWDTASKTVEDADLVFAGTWGVVKTPKPTDEPTPGEDPKPAEKPAPADRPKPVEQPRALKLAATGASFGGVLAASGLLAAAGAAVALSRRARR